ncbi:MAG: signal recognition particle receptor subunit alpha, partial [Actinomycetales bacterium]|nr:signal recognition particle receptor subunit alpha [Actinomycetales bacterium]
MAFEWFKKVKDKVVEAISEAPVVDTSLHTDATVAPEPVVVEPVFVEPVAVEPVSIAAPEPEPEPEPTPEPEPEVVPEPAPQPVVATPAPVPVIAEPEPERQLEVGQRSFASRIRSLFSGIQFDPANLDDLEDILLLADFGVDASEAIVAEVKRLAAVVNAKTERELKNILISVLTNSLELPGRELNLAGEKLPYVFLMVGVNGVGKTTTIGKLAAWLAEGEWEVVIGAADTFRAAAVEQVATWAKRAGAKLVGPEREGQDPASVAFTAVETAVADKADIVIVDTAGRLQNKLDLMQELSKIRRVVEKTVPVSEVLLVIDATTGQNGLLQAKAFAEVAQVTGVVLTKVDGT